MLGEIAGAAARTLIPGAMNVMQGGIGNAAGRGATFGNKQRFVDEILNYANQNGVTIDDITTSGINRNRDLMNQDVELGQRVNERGAAFGRQIQADRMRQDAFNTMARDSQQQRADAARNLLDDYGRARDSAMNMVSNSYRLVY